MLIGGIESVKIMSVVTGLPLIFVLFLLMLAVKRTLEQDIPKDEKL